MNAMRKSERYWMVCKPVEKTPIWLLYWVLGKLWPLSKKQAVPAFEGTLRARFSGILSGGFRIAVDGLMSIIPHRWKCHPGKPNVAPAGPVAVDNVGASAEEGVVIRTAVGEGTSSKEVINKGAISSNKVDITRAVIIKEEGEEDTVKEIRAV